MDHFFTSRDSTSSPNAYSTRLTLGAEHDFESFTLPPIETTRTYHYNSSTGLHNHLDTLRDVETAFHNADVALRHAREALRSDAIMSSRLASARGITSNNAQVDVNNNNVVDLTTIPSDTSNDDPEVQWSYTRHPNDPQPRTRETRLFNHFANRNVPATFGAVGHLPHIRPHIHFAPPIVSNRRADEHAIRRQRQARRDWERVQRRNVERAAQQAQRDAIEQARRSTAGPSTANEHFNANINSREGSPTSSVTDISEISDASNDSEDVHSATQQDTQTHTANSTMPSTQQSIDLTSTEDPPTLKDKLLSQQQQSAIAAQNTSSTTTSKDSHSTPLSTYRCAICMDTPTTATTTICGHLFCHTCLKDSLKWSAQQRRDEAGMHGRRMPNAGTGLCPVCRKVLNDKEGGKTQSIVGLEIRAIPRAEWEGRKKQERLDGEREALLERLRLDTEMEKMKKQKGKERETDGDVKNEVKMEDDEGVGPMRSTIARGGRKRTRAAAAADYENDEGY